MDYEYEPPPFMGFVHEPPPFIGQFAPGALSGHESPGNLPDCDSMFSETALTDSVDLMESHVLNRPCLVTSEVCDADYWFPRELPFDIKPRKMPPKKPFSEEAFNTFLHTFQGGIPWGATNDQMRNLFILSMQVFVHHKQLMRHNNINKLAEEEATREYQASIAEFKNVQRNPIGHEYVQAKGFMWKSFNGFRSFRPESLFPIGEFADRCNRCDTFVIFSGMIACNIHACLDGKNMYNCNAELCISCFWIYQKSRMKNTARLRVSQDLLESVLVAQKLEREKPNYQKVYEEKLLHYHTPYDEPTRPTPELNTWFKPYSSDNADDRTYGVFITAADYPEHPTRVFRNLSIVPKFETGKCYDLSELAEAQRVDTRERHAKEKSDDPAVHRTRSDSLDMDEDIRFCLVSDDKCRKAKIRTKVLGPEIIMDRVSHMRQVNTCVPNAKKNTYVYKKVRGPRGPYKKKKSPKKSNRRV